jgi:hypothetical protein
MHIWVDSADPTTFTTETSVLSYLKELILSILLRLSQDHLKVLKKRFYSQTPLLGIAKPHISGVSIAQSEYTH